MLRHKRILNLTAALAISLVGLSTLAEADFCLWCDPVISQKFIICVSDKIMNDPRFASSAEALDDMKGSIIAASKAMKKSSQSTKMKMMNGAMSGELAELIKFQYSLGYSQNTMTFMMEIVRDCYVEATGQPHYDFMQDIGKTVHFMLSDDPQPYDILSDSKSAPPQYQTLTLANSAVYSGQNSMPLDYNAQEQQPSLTQSASNDFIPNQMYVPPVPGIIPEVRPAYPQTGLRNPVNFIGGQVEPTAVNLNYPLDKQYNNPFIWPGPNVQSPSAQINAARSYDSPEQNKLPKFVHDQNKWQSFAPYTNVLQNNKVAGSGAVISPLTAPNQFVPQNTVPLNNAAPSFDALNTNAARLGSLFRANPPNIGTDQFYPQTNGPVNNAVQSYAFNDKGNLQSFVPRLAIPPPGSAATGDATTDNAWGTNSGGNGLPSDSFQLNNAAVAAPKENKRNPVSQPESKPKFGKWAPSTTVKSSGQKNSPSSVTDDDYIARAMRFAETVYVLCSQNRKFKTVFNKRISNNKAASYTYKIIRGALNDCGYVENSEDIAKSCSDTVKSLPAKCSTAEYGEAISKSLMDAFYSKKLIGDNPENQAKSITAAFLAKLKKRKSAGVKPYSTSNASPSIDSLLDNQANKGVGNDNSPNSAYMYNQDYPKDTDGTFKETYGETASSGGLPVQESKGGDSNDDSGRKQYQGMNYDYDNYPNPEMNYQYPIKTEKPKAIETTQTMENPEKQSVGKTGYNYYQMYGDYPNSQQNNGQNQKSNEQILSPKDNQKYDYYNQNSNYGYDPNYDYYNQYNDYGYNQPNIGKVDSPNDNYNQYNRNFDNLNLRPNQQPYTKTAQPADYTGQPVDFTDQPTDDYNYRNDNSFMQNANPDYYKYPVSNNKQLDDSYDKPKSSASVGSLAMTKKSGNSEAKNGKTIKNEENKSLIVQDYSKTNSSTSDENADSSQTNPEYGITLKKDIQLGQSEFPNSTNNEDGKKIFSETALANPDGEKAERKSRLNVLMKWALSSISKGKFNYKVYSSVISAMAKYLQKTHPELGSQKCFLTILIESLAACTQLLTRIPEEYLVKMSVPEYTDAADETMANGSTSSLKQENKDSSQPDQRKSARNDQTYVTPQQNWNNGYGMSQTYSNSNAPLAKQKSWETNVPQSGVATQAISSSQERYQALPQQNNWKNEYQSSQRNSFMPEQNRNTAKQKFAHNMPDANINASLPRQESWITNVPQSGRKSLAIFSPQEKKKIQQRNNQNNEYQSSQVINNNVVPQDYNKKFPATNLNAPLPRLENWITNVPQSGGEVYGSPTLQEGFKDLQQQNNWNNDYQSNQRNSFRPVLNKT